MELTSLADLLDVQDLDSRIDRLLEERRNLPELAAYKAAHEELGTLDVEIAEASDILRTLELDFDKSEGELEILEAKLNEHETRLFAGSMSARETEHMRLEVESLRGQREAMESRVLKLLDNVDPVREQVGQLQERRDNLVAEKARLEASIKEDWKRIDAEIARKEERKAEAISPVPPDLLELYEKLRAAKEGVAVGRFENGVCGGCNMALSPAERNEALSAEIPRCVHCRRILVA
jgi:predicted  nucleic acid-binding Zn-ribbon protein